MSTSDYRRGVEDGTAAFGSEHVFPGTCHKVHTPGCELWGEPLGVRIEKLLKERRKTLLTKKVTKWFAVYDNFGTGSLRIYGEALFGKTTLFNTKEEALKQLDGVDILVGAYPIEIEVEL